LLSVCFSFVVCVRFVYTAFSKVPFRQQPANHSSLAPPKASELWFVLFGLLHHASTLYSGATASNLIQPLSLAADLSAVPTRQLFSPSLHSRRPVPLSLCRPLAPSPLPSLTPPHTLSSLSQAPSLPPLLVFSVHNFIHHIRGLNHPDPFLQLQPVGQPIA